MINEGSIKRFLDSSEFDPTNYRVAEELADDLVFKLLGLRIADYNDLRKQKGLGRLFADTAKDAAASILKGVELGKQLGEAINGKSAQEVHRVSEATYARATATATLIAQLERVARTYVEQN